MPGHGQGAIRDRARVKGRPDVGMNLCDWAGRALLVSEGNVESYAGSDKSVVNQGWGAMHNGMGETVELVMGDWQNLTDRKGRETKADIKQVGRWARSQAPEDTSEDTRKFNLIHEGI